jgi:hypothetical protein
MGSAWATNISELLAAALLLLAFRATRPIVWLGFRVVAAPALIAFLIVGTLYVLSPPTFIALPIVIVSYSLGAFITGAVRRSEIVQVWQLIVKSISPLKCGAAARAL